MMSAPSRQEVVLAALGCELTTLADGRSVHRVVREFVREGSRTVRVSHPIHESGHVIAYYGIGHRHLYWREA